jgi:subtilisin family serine protease
MLKGRFEVVGKIVAKREPQRRLRWIPGQMILRVREDAVRPAVGTGLRLTATAARMLPAPIAEPMPARWAQATGSPDPMINRQWGLRAINWFAAKRVRAGTIAVGVMDTGIDARHPDLRSAIRTYHHDGLGAADLLGHGTHVSGIIAARINNSIGIAGVASCKIVMWKIFGDEPESDGEFYVDGERFLRALGDASGAGVRVVNLSLGGTESSDTEQLLVRRLERAGVVVVAAMGNEYEDGNPTEYPAAYDSVLAVGAVAETLRRSVFSNTGRHIVLVAPGSNILSTLPRKRSPYLDETDYAAWSGTSMATPHVAGVAALAAAKHPDWDAVAIKKHLAASTAKVPGMRGKKRTDHYGTGLIDVDRSV